MTANTNFLTTAYNKSSTFVKAHAKEVSYGIAATTAALAAIAYKTNRYTQAIPALLGFSGSGLVYNVPFKGKNYVAGVTAIAGIGITLANKFINAAQIAQAKNYLYNANPFASKQAVVVTSAVVTTPAANLPKQ